MPEISRFFGIVIYMNWRDHPPARAIGVTAMILHTTEVSPHPGHRLYARFNNGVAGEIDLSGEREGEVFEALHTPALFATAYQHPVMRTVAWANSADLAPEFLLGLLRGEAQHVAWW